ncbi:uncharacterized protein PSFLO_03267 [Pseudozyma flocculosa]|uniref:Uncharacterized protein n=1 Tax=Pseudozyma flocculosa TaxID=84751 RepID=A0A5C3F3E2_9BASI|nr:uncharacterized protein PSFLO_03267 [Pseudozyma flocculosa]
MPLIQFATPPTRESAFQGGRPPARSDQAHHLPAPSRSPLPPSQTQQQQRRQQPQAPPAVAATAISQPEPLGRPSATAAEVQPEPLTFEKRPLARTPSSPEPAENKPQPTSPVQSTDLAAGTSAATTFLPASGLSAREPKSLLADALSNHRPQRPALPSAVSSGILRKDRGADSPTSLASAREAHTTDDDVAPRDTRTPITPLKTHFVEPVKPRRSPSRSPPRHAAAKGDRPTSQGAPRQTAVRLHRSEQVDQHLTLTEERVASLGSEPPVLTRRRCLVFQESSDVLERAAERAARHARADGVGGHGAAGEAAAAAASASADASRRRGSQHSTSSAGEESCSTRSSWVPRGSSPPTSLAASPTGSLLHADKETEEEDNEADYASGDDGNDNEDDATPARTPSAETPTALTGVAQTSASTPKAADLAPAAAVDKALKLTFAQSPQEILAQRKARHDVDLARPRPSLSKFKASSSPAPSRPGRLGHAEPGVEAKLPEEAPQEAAGAVADSTKRSLSFTVCPHPERDQARDPSSRSKLSGSPAPNALSYKQRVSGIRGGGPIRSPAPHAAEQGIRPSSIASSTLSASSSGYSEDEEDDSEDYEEDDELTDSGADTGEGVESDLGSNDEDDDAASERTDATDDDDEEEDEEEEVLDASETDQPSLSRPTAGKAPETGLGRSAVAPWLLQNSAGDAGDRGTDSDAANQRMPKIGFLETVKRRSLSQGDAADRTRLPDDTAAAVAGQTSPRRGDRSAAHPPGPSSRSKSPAPKTLARTRPALVSRDSRNFSHPMCFLPDTFEDSAPTSPALSTHNDAHDLASSGLPGQHYASDLGSGPNSRRCSWQNPSGAAGPTSGATPLSLPFHRGRDRAPASGPTSDAEAAGPQHMTWRGPSWMQAHSLHAKPADIADATEAGHAASSLGLTSDGVPLRPVQMRHASSKAVDDYQRAWSSLHRRDSSSVASPPGTQAVSPTRNGTPMSSVGLLCPGTLSPRSPPTRPASAQRALSTASQVRCKPAMAQCSTAAVVGATSPPKDNALSHLKHYFDHPPAAFGDVSRTSEGTTPASGTHSPVLGGGAGAVAARYWNETLTALAHAMAGESTHAEHSDHAREGYRSEPGEYGRHGRSRSAPLDALVGPQGAVPSSSSAWPGPPEACPDSGASHRDAPADEAHSAGGAAAWHRAVSPAPRPIRIASPPAAAWNSDRDGEALARPRQRRPRTATSKKPTRTVAKSQGASPPSALLEYMRREVGPDGHTRLVVVEDDERRLRTRRKKKTSSTSMEFNWGRCKITNPAPAPATVEGGEDAQGAEQPR